MRKIRKQEKDQGRQDHNLFKEVKALLARKVKIKNQHKTLKEKDWILRHLREAEAQEVKYLQNQIE